MAIFKHGLAVAEIRGSVAGATFSRNRAGAYIRNRTKPVNPQSNRQIEIRENLTYLQAYWHNTLTVITRAPWDSVAASNPINNRLGDASAMSGFNLFLRVNALRLLIGLTITTTPPTPPLQLDIQSFSIAAVSASGLSITGTGPFVGPNIIIYLSFTEAMSQARNFFKGPYTRRAFFTALIPMPAVIDPTVTVGDRYHYAWRSINTATNRISAMMHSHVDCLA